MTKMVKYTEYRLGELCKRFSSGKGIDADLISESGQYPVIGGNGLRGYTNTFNFDGECAVIGRQGAYCGNVKFFSGKGYMTEHAVVTEPKDSNNAKYLSYKLGGLSLGRFSGQAAQPGLSVNKLARLRIEMPPKWYQDKIASILSTYDDLIENNNKRIRILEQMAENLYKEWFVRFRFPGYETTPFENGIPKGWSEEKLSAVFEVKYGKDHKNLEDGIIPIFGSGGIMRYGNKALCSEESVLIPRKGSLNNVMYYKGDFWTVDTMFYTKMKIKHCAKYTYFTLSKVDLEGLNSGASIPSMTTDILYHLKMIVPEESTLIAFDKQIDALFAEKDHLEIQNQNLVKQRNLLLPRLMSGKLAV